MPSATACGVGDFPLSDRYSACPLVAARCTGTGRIGSLTRGEGRRGLCPAFWQRFPIGQRRLRSAGPCYSGPRAQKRLAMSWNSGAQTARRDVVADFRIFRIFEICGSESSFAPLEEMVRNARIDSMIIDQCMAIHSGIYLDSIILINHH